MHFLISCWNDNSSVNYSLISSTFFQWRQAKLRTLTMLSGTCILLIITFSVLCCNCLFINTTPPWKMSHRLFPYYLGTHSIWDLVAFQSEKAMAPHSSTLAWKIPWMEEPGRLQSMGLLSWTWLSDFTFTFCFHALEKEMATHSSVLAWRIPGLGEPGRLPSVGSQRVKHDWSDLGVSAVAASQFSDGCQKSWLLAFQLF